MTPPPRNRRRQHPANRRRPRPSATHGAARRHSRWLARQLQRAGLWLRALPARLRSTADTAGSAGRLLRPWSEPAAPPPSSADTGLQIVLDDDDATTPTGTLRTPAVPASAALGDPADSAATLPADSGSSPSPSFPAPRARSSAPAPSASSSPRRPSPSAASSRRGPPSSAGSSAGNSARSPAAARPRPARASAPAAAAWPTCARSCACSAASSPRSAPATLWLLGGLARGSTIVGDRLAGALARHQALLLALLTRALWWTALVLLFLGGRALVEIHERSPFLATALPSLLAGLALCAFLLLFASQARMRWAAFALGLGHGGLLALVWVVSAVA